MDELTMAHEHAQGLLSKKKTEFYVLKDVVAEAWRYADAMQAEADKRKEKGFREAIRSLTKDNVGNCMHFHREFGHKNCMDCGASLEQWQPDWSQAPEWAKYWIKTSGGSFAWLDRKPDISKINPHWNVECFKKSFAPSFNYQGNWEDSLRKRPEIKANKRLEVG